jgi:hypothetical protein
MLTRFHQVCIKKASDQVEKTTYKGAHFSVEGIFSLRWSKQP